MRVGDWRPAPLRYGQSDNRGASSPNRECCTIVQAPPLISPADFRSALTTCYIQALRDTSTKCILLVSCFLPNHFRFHCLPPHLAMAENCDDSNCLINTGHGCQSSSSSSPSENCSARFNGELLNRASFGRLLKFSAVFLVFVVSLLLQMVLGPDAFCYQAIP